eukprot:TRINITY_DN21442_c0_g1_i1.p1 TRINITY_DN21442_c0_g1~~TRINITY_DN21442_c0_g1_i1.p1  ORF type:complete len:138 (-),score=17.66 TRINITY_DN21442_c0_g1_i1:94-483(-)
MGSHNLIIIINVCVHNDKTLPISRSLLSDKALSIMMFSLIVQGFGVSVIVLIGTLGIVLHFLLYSRREKNYRFENILMVNLIFSKILLLSGFSLISVTAFYEFLEYHSNSHFFLLPFLMFTTCVGSVIS